MHLEKMEAVYFHFLFSESRTPATFSDRCYMLWRVNFIIEYVVG